LAPAAQQLHCGMMICAMQAGAFGTIKS